MGALRLENSFFEDGECLYVLDLVFYRTKCVQMILLYEREQFGHRTLGWSDAERSSCLTVERCVYDMV